jgi:hypothetical protein
LNLSSQTVESHRENLKKNSTSGIRIWQLLSEGHSISEAIERIHNEYDVLPDAAQKSVLNLTQELIAENLVAKF